MTSTRKVYQFFDEDGMPIGSYIANNFDKAVSQYCSGGVQSEEDIRDWYSFEVTEEEDRNAEVTYMETYSRTGDRKIPCITIK